MFRDALSEITLQIKSSLIIGRFGDTFRSPNANVNSPEKSLRHAVEACGAVPWRMEGSGKSAPATERYLPPSARNFAAVLEQMSGSV